MRTEVWRDCRNVEGGWRCVTEHGKELFIQYPPDYAERFNTGPARVPELEKGHTCHVERNGERIEVIIDRAHQNFRRELTLSDGGLNWRSITPK
jgi:hypothetical protein